MHEVREEDKPTLAFLETANRTSTFHKSLLTRAEPKAAHFSKHSSDLLMGFQRKEVIGPPLDVDEIEIS